MSDLDHGRVGPEGGRAEELRHPDCRWCVESSRINVGIMEENRQLKHKLDELCRRRVSAAFKPIEELLAAAQAEDDPLRALEQVNAAQRLLAEFEPEEGR